MVTATTPGDSSSTFPKTARLRKSPQFARTLEAGERFITKFFVFSFVRNTGSTEGARLGITISKKISKLAVKRNKVKRALREIFRKSRAQLPTGLDLVVNARHGSSELSTNEIHAEFLRGLKKKGLLP